MLIDVIQKDTYVEVSYTTHEGNIDIGKVPLPPEGYSNWKLCEDDDPDRDPVFHNYDGKCVKRVKGKQFYDLNLHEFLVKRTDPEWQRKIFGFNKPNFFSVDIETRITSDCMPKAEEAPTDILSISITAVNMATIILSTRECNMERANKIVQDYLAEYGKEHNLTFPTKHIVFDSEKEMLIFFLNMVRTRFHLHGGWNYTGYDWTYIKNRCIKNGINIEISSPAGMVEDGVPVHRIVIDYMEAYKAGSRGNSSLLSYRLDAVAEYELGLHKLSYDKTLKELYEQDYDRFIAYAIIDTILVQLIHKKTNKIDVLFNMCYYTKVPFKRSDGNIAQTDALQFEEFYNDNLVYADERKNGVKEKYEGAYVKEPVFHEADFPACYDAKSLYPSTMMTYDISPELYIGKCKPNEVQKLREKGFFVSDKLSVYRRTETGGAFKKLETKLFGERGKFKSKMLYAWDKLTVLIEDEAKRRGLKLDDGHG